MRGVDRRLGRRVDGRATRRSRRSSPAPGRCGSITPWHWLQVLVCAMLLEPRAHASSALRLLRRRGWCPRPAAAASAACPSACRAPRRRAAPAKCGRHRKCAAARRPCPAGRSAFGSSSFTRRNCGPEHAGDAVVPRQALVEEACSRPSAARSTLLVLEQHARAGTARSRWRNPGACASLNAGTGAVGIDGLRGRRR